MRKLFISLFFVIFTVSIACSQENVYKLGDTADIKNIAVTISSIQPHKEKNRFINKQGIKYYAVYITVLNGSREPYEYNAYQFTLIDDSSEEYQWCISTVEPKFEGEILQPGMVGKGFLVFGIPQERTPKKLMFDPGYISENLIQFNITNVK